jgi:hypothetical protein
MTLPQLWAFVAVALPLIRTRGGLGAIDLAYHLRAGGLMLDSGSLLRTDPFTYTVQGTPWLNQQWAGQILFAQVFRLMGWVGLGLFQALLVGLAFAFVYLACRGTGVRPRTASLLTLASFVVGAYSLTLRPQLLGVVLFAASLWIVLGRRHHPGRLLALPPIVAVWANVHGSFFLAPLMVGLVWLQDRLDRDPGATRTGLIGLASVVAATLNPWGLRVWEYAAGISTNELIFSLVSEWQPPSIRQPEDAIFFVSALATVFVLARQKRPAPWPVLLWLGVFFVIALTATRNTLWWGLAAAPLVAGLLAERARPARKELPANLLNTAIAAGLILFFAGYLTSFAISLHGGPLRSDEELVVDAPRGVTTTLLRALEPGDRIFNGQRWGSWFELALPENPVFIDSRIELFPGSVWREYLAVSAGRQGWQALLERHRVTAVAANPDQQRDLIPLLRGDPGWRLLYEGDDGLVFLRA